MGVLIIIEVYRCLSQLNNFRYIRRPPSNWEIIDFIPDLSGFVAFHAQTLSARFIVYVRAGAGRDCEAGARGN